jgi:hypothetical protein
LHHFAKQYKPSDIFTPQADLPPASIRVPTRQPKTLTKPRNPIVPSSSSSRSEQLLSSARPPAARPRNPLIPTPRSSSRTDHSSSRSSDRPTYQSKAPWE